MKKKNFPPGWDDDRVRRLLEHYERQSEEGAVAEDEAAFNSPGVTVMPIPNDLVSKVRSLLASRRK